MILSLFCIILAYVLGSISSAIIVSKLFGLPNPRQQGSKNPGATNVLRLAGKKYAAIVLVGDVLKGLIPLLIAKVFGVSSTVLACTAFAAVLGHVYPVFFDFQGGKGVATAIGALLGFDLLVGILVIITWVLVAKTTRYSSLSALISIGSSPLFVYLISPPTNLIPLLLMVALIFYQHRNNIVRLKEGIEPKIGDKSSSSRT